MRIVTMLLLASTFSISAEEPKCSISSHISGPCIAQLEQRALNAYDKSLVKSGEILEIHLQNGETTRLVGNSAGEGYEDYRSYHVLGVLNPTQLAVVIVGRWEGRQVLLVSLKDGTTYDVDGVPLVSPDQKRVLVHSMDIDANYDANIIAIYHVVGSRLEKEFTLSGDGRDSEQWGPTDVRWRPSSEIEFLRVTHSSDSSGYSREPWELIKKGKNWAAQPSVGK